MKLIIRGFVPEHGFCIDDQCPSPDCSGNPFLQKKIATESGK